MFRFLLFFCLIGLAFGQGSWQSYVDDQLIEQGFTQAAIIGHDATVWAISNGFSLEAGEGTALASLFENPANAFVNGITIAGIKYLGIKADGKSIYGKKGTGGVVTAKTAHAIIIGVYGDSLQPGKAANTFEKLATDLRDNGY